MQQDQKWYRALYAFWQKNERVIWRGLEFVGLITAIIALVVGIFAWIETRKSNELAREAIDDSRIAQSWQIVTTRAPGSSGKKQALERLYASGESLQGVDLSCQTMGGWDDEKQKCVSPTNLQGVNLAKTEERIRANLSHVNFSYADMLVADLTGADMWGANLTGADMWAANLTGVVFCHDPLGCAENLSQGQIDRAWAWADRPPVFKAGEYALELDMPPLCDPGLREAYEANQLIGKPWDC